jgi:hypothetical protein
MNKIAHRNCHEEDIAAQKGEESRYRAKSYTRKMGPRGEMYGQEKYW